MYKTSHIPHYLIESFLVAVDGPTLQIAADKMGITQSALSRQMMLLESLLPYKIFVFQGRNKILTKYGHTLYEFLAPQFSQTQGLINHASLLFADAKLAQIKICGRGEFLDAIATRLNFQGQVSFFNMDSAQAQQAVLSRRSDVGIVHSWEDSSELILKPYCSTRLRIVIPKSFFKTKPASQKILLEKIQKLPCLLYKADDPIVEKFLQEFDISFKNLNISRVFSSYSTLIKMINANQGWGIIPSNLEISESNFHVLQLSGNSLDKKDFYLCYRAELKGAIWFKQLLSDLKKIGDPTLT